MHLIKKSVLLFCVSLLALLLSSSICKADNFVILFKYSKGDCQKCSFALLGLIKSNPTLPVKVLCPKSDSLRCLKDLDFVNGGFELIPNDKLYSKFDNLNTTEIIISDPTYNKIYFRCPAVEYPNRYSIIQEFVNVNIDIQNTGLVLALDSILEFALFNLSDDIVLQIDDSLIIYKKTTDGGIRRLKSIYLPLSPNKLLGFLHEEYGLNLKEYYDNYTNSIDSVLRRFMPPYIEMDYISHIGDTLFISYLIHKNDIEKDQKVIKSDFFLIISLTKDGYIDAFVVDPMVKNFGIVFPLISDQEKYYLYMENYRWFIRKRKFLGSFIRQDSALVFNSFVKIHKPSFYLKLQRKVKTDFALINSDNKTVNFMFSGDFFDLKTRKYYRIPTQINTDRKAFVSNYNSYKDDELYVHFSTQRFSDITISNLRYKNQMILDVYNSLSNNYISNRNIIPGINTMVSDWKFHVNGKSKIVYFVDQLSGNVKSLSIN